MWYKVHQIAADFYRIQEPGHVSFYMIQRGNKAILIDTGLGIAKKEFQDLLFEKGIEKFSVLTTHLHCDHAGMNFMAEKVYVSQDEHEKYNRLHDQKQLLHYHELLKDYKSWPNEEVTTTSDFSSQVNFIEKNKVLVYDQEFEVITTPGHTIGHLCFISHDLKSIFLGDLIYDGMLYLNLPDSNFENYIDSLIKIMEVSESTNYTLLPCHNSIPLDRGYIKKVYEACLKIKSKILLPSKLAGENTIFKESDEFILEDVKIQISKVK